MQIVRRSPSGLYERRKLVSTRGVAARTSKNDFPLVGSNREKPVPAKRRRSAVTGGGPLPAKRARFAGAGAGREHIKKNKKYQWRV